MTIRHIVAATDLSTAAEHAAYRAARLAVESGAALLLVHVVSKNGLDRLATLMPDFVVMDSGRIEEAIRRDVESLALTLRQHVGVSPEVFVTSGAVLDEITTCADRRNADLLVLGAQGKERLRDWLLGSTTERLLRRTRRPALIVKQKPTAPYRRILVPVDFSAHAAAALRMARTVAPEAELVLAHIAEIPFAGKLENAGVSKGVMRELQQRSELQARAAMDDFVRQAELGSVLTQRVIRQGDVPTIIAELETQLDCDLVVMGKRGLSLTDELLLGSVTRHVLARSHCDVLVADRTQPTV
jgi:nucleotide-binding universal stress UspA family protein